MGDFTDSTTVDVRAEALFDYLSDVRHLPKYFAAMTKAEPGEDQQVHTTARLPDGREVAGDAWFRIDDVAQRIAWGSEGPNDYHGYLDVLPSGQASEIELYLHTTRVASGDGEVIDGMRQTLANIQQLFKAET